MTGEGLTHQERLSQRVLCPECDVDLAAGYLVTQQNVHNRVGREDMRAPPPSPADPHINIIFFPWEERDIT